MADDSLKLVDKMSTHCPVIFDQSWDHPLDCSCVYFLLLSRFTKIVLEDQGHIILDIVAQEVTLI